MGKTFLLLAVTLVLLGACSPAAYKVNSSTSQQEIPESQQDGYMRILGDLRWDKLRTREDWMARFPGCLNTGPNEYLLESGWMSGQGRTQAKPSCRFDIGGLAIVLDGVSFEKEPNPSSPKRTRTQRVFIHIPRADHSRAFDASVSQKHLNVINDAPCSRYTCFDLTGWNYGIKWLSPTRSRFHG